MSSLPRLLCAAIHATAALPGAAQNAADIRQDAKGVTQVFVPPGCFLMGTTAAQLATARESNPPSWVNQEFKYEQPQHEVCLTAGYWIDRTEVTNAAFAAFVADNGYGRAELWSSDGLAWLSYQDKAQLPVACAPQPPDHPRVCVTWYEAEAYATWRGGRLPTEAQWEFAARGPSSLVYPWGNDWDPDRANVVDSTGTTPVGNFPTGTTWVGALDMSGNAMEWAQDWLSSTYYGQSPKNDPPGPATGTRKVEKGGWWGSNPFVARGAYKHFEDPPEYQDHHIGFRIVAPLKQPNDVQGLRWNAPAGSESGWGVNFAHQGDTLFATWFTFGLDGKPLWMVVAATKTGPGTYSGSLYSGTGPAFNSNPFDPAKVVPVQAGTATFRFTDDDNGSFAYTVGGVAQTKPITRQTFANPVPTCVAGGDGNFAQATNYQDIWWNDPPSSEAGWGINLNHQGDVIFATWFTYGLDGKPLWLVAAASRTTPNAYSGKLYTGTGPAYNAVPFDPTKVTATEAGTIALTFADGNSAAFAYTVDGVAQTKQIRRQVFGAPATACQ